MAANQPSLKIKIKRLRARLGWWWDGKPSMVHGGYVNHVVATDFGFRVRVSIRYRKAINSFKKWLPKAIGTIAVSVSSIALWNWMSH
jgi:hypothetical protein